MRLFAALLCLVVLAPVANADVRLLVSGFSSDRVGQYDPETGVYIGPLDRAAGLDGPQSITTGPDGLLYVCSENDNSVFRFDPQTGAFIDIFVAPGNGLNAPTAAIFGPDFNDDDNGDLYVASFNTDSILVYDGLTGAFLDVFVTVGSGGLNGPDAGMNFGPDGNLYVPSFWSHAILRYDGGSGAFIDAFVSPGAGGLAWPRVVLFREDGRVIVSAEASDQVLLYDGGDGTPLGALIDGITTPTGMAIRDDMLYVASIDSDSVSRYDVMTGDFIDTVVANGDGGLDAPTFVAFTEPLAVIPGDLDGDGSVGPADLILLLGQWGVCEECAACIADLDDDCIVGAGDLITLLGNWS